MTTALRTEDILDAAYEAFAAEDFEAARRHLEEARQADPQAREVLLLEIDLLDVEGEGEEAVARAEQATKLHPHDLLLRVRFATLLLDVYDDVAEARPHLEEAWRQVRAGERPDLGDDEEAEETFLDFQLELLLTLSDSRAADHDPRGALEAADAAIELDRDDPMARLARAASLFDLGRLDDAERAIAQALDRDARFADAFWLRGRVLTVRGDDAGAEKALSRAVALDPERFAAPHRISEAEFAALMEEALEELPEPVQKYLKNVAIAVEDVPPLERLLENDPPLSPGSLGLYEGVPPSLAPGDDPWAHFPSQITLFRKNIELSASTEDELRDLIASTLLHEVGHFLGLDEEDLEERGLD